MYRASSEASPSSQSAVRLMCGCVSPKAVTRDAMPLSASRMRLLCAISGSPAFTAHSIRSDQSVLSIFGCG